MMIVDIKLEDIDGKRFAKVHSETEQYVQDGLPDLLIQPIDGCLQQQEVLFNKNQQTNHKRTYQRIFLDFASYLTHKANK